MFSTCLNANVSLTKVYTLLYYVEDHLTGLYSSLLKQHKRLAETSLPVENSKDAPLLLVPKQRRNKCLPDAIS